VAGAIKGNAAPVIYSVLLHGAIVAALVYLTMMSRPPPTLVQSSPINATVIDSQVLRAAQRAQERDAQARAAAEQAAAKAAADKQAAEQAARAEALAKAAEEAQSAKAAEQAKQAAAAKAAQDAQAEAARAAEARREADAKAQAQAKAAADAKAQAEAKAAADAKAAAEAKAAADAKAAAEHARKEREAELHRQLAEEEHVDAVEASPLRDRYIASLRSRIQNAWIKPPSARVGVDCLVEVTQVPGGEVTSAHVSQCNGDAAVRQSIENAVYRASPLPDPPDPALFQRNFAFRFKPDE
jgi:colicin import membrane protein